MSRILDGDSQIVQLINNYSKISFKLRPYFALLGFEAKAPDVYDAILEADRESQKKFSRARLRFGQVYNHMILPLANARESAYADSMGHP